VKRVAGKLHPNLQAVLRRERGLRSATMARYYFHGHEANRFEALNGLPLAGFWQRGLGLAIDLAAGLGLWLGLEVLWSALVGHPWHGWRWPESPFDWLVGRTLIAVSVYCAVVQYASNGRSLGKWVARTQVVSLLGEQLGFWQCVERVLGYAVSVVEGLGFLQYFWNDNRMCVQDRMAETVVLDLRKSALRVGGVDDEDALVELVEGL
jgi:uncharacterized RDD family membrane protein YckC